MSSTKWVNYQTVGEFEEAMWLAFEAERALAPDDAVLRRIAVRRDDADAAQKSCAATAGADFDSGAPLAVAATLKTTRERTQQDALTALKKWYSGHWRAKQAR